MAETDQQTAADQQSADTGGFRPALGGDLQSAIRAQPQPQPPAADQQSAAATGDGFRPVTGMRPGPEEEQQGKSVLDFAVNQAIPSAINLAKNSFSAVRHLDKTTETLGNLIAGSFKAGMRGVGVDIDSMMDQNESDRVTRAFGQYLKHRYGSADAAWESFYHDPAGVMADFSSLITGAGGVVRGAATLTKLAAIAPKVAGLGEVGALGTTAEALNQTANVLGKAGEVTSPVNAAGYVAKGVGKVAAYPIRKLFPAAPAAAAPSAAAVDDAIRQRAYQYSQARSGDPMSDWLQAERDVKGAPGTAAAPPTDIVGKLKQFVRQNVGSGLGGIAATTAIDLLTHHLVGGFASGVLSAGGLHMLQSPAGRAILSSVASGIGPGSTAAQIAAAAGKLMPALNTLYQTQQQRQRQRQQSSSMLSPPITVNPQQVLQQSPQSSPFGFARGGAVNPELARIQRERLRLPGILETLEKFK